VIDITTWEDAVTRNVGGLLGDGSDSLIRDPTQPDDTASSRRHGRSNTDLQNAQSPLKMNHNMSSDTLPHFLHLLIPNALHPFLLLSYPVSSAPAFVSPFGRFQPTLSPTLYDKGPQDLYFIVFCAMAFTVLREVVVRCLLRSFAWSWLNSSGKKRDRISRRQWRLRDHTATRFAEQGWSFCYCAVFWTLGMVRRPLVTLSC